MTTSARLYFEKYNVRQLKVPAVSRAEFNRAWAKKLRMMKDSAISDMAPGTPAEEREETLRVIEEQFYRAMGCKYSYFLAVHILGQKWMDTDYCFRLCNDVDHN